MAETMTASGMTDGQIDNAVDKLRAAMRKHRSEISSDVAQQVLGIENIGMELFAPFRRRAEAMLVLVPRSPVTVTLSKRHEPDTYYRTREGLYVSEDFCKRIVTKAQPTKSGTSFALNVADLGRDSTDEEIEATLPPARPFDETVLCAVIAGLHAQQPNGEEGSLLTERVNLFYLLSRVVHVHWLAVGRRWVVSSWHRDGSRWSAGLRVFSPAS